MSSINNYFGSIVNRSLEILKRSSKDDDIAGKVHGFALSIEDWANTLPFEELKYLLKYSIEQLEVSYILLSLGFYKSSFAALRLSYEISVGHVYYSVDLISYAEWKQGKKDFSFARVTGGESGIFSKRFVDAFYPELLDESKNYHQKSKDLYRSLSEYVHGGYDTWSLDGTKLQYAGIFVKNYSKLIDNYAEVFNFIYSLRFLRSLDSESISKIEDSVMEYCEHINVLRTHFGGQN